MSELTHVELLWVKKRVENWIRFGRTTEEHVIDQRRRLVSFTPGSIFAFIRWAANDYGTVVSRVDILRAVGPGERYSTVPLCATRRREPAAPRAVGRRSRRCCRRSTLSRRSASIPPTLRRITGGRSITACRSASGRDHTRRAAIKLGCADARCGRDTSLDYADHHGWRTCALWLSPAPGPYRCWFGMHPRAHPSASTTCSRRGVLFVTTLVVAMPPEPLASSLARGGYLPPGVPLLKRILALPGQSVCRDELIISVDGVNVGTARERDRRGRVLPVWQGCRTIADGEVFLMNWDEPASLDSRYFGPIPRSAIIGRAEPLWTFGED